MSTGGVAGGEGSQPRPPVVLQEEVCVEGCRVVVLRVGRKQALELLHEVHPGMARMKALKYCPWLHVVAGIG